MDRDEFRGEDDKMINATDRIEPASNTLEPESAALLQQSSSRPHNTIPSISSRASTTRNQQAQTMTSAPFQGQLGPPRRNSANKDPIVISTCEQMRSFCVEQRKVFNQIKDITVRIHLESVVKASREIPKRGPDVLGPFPNHLKRLYLLRCFPNLTHVVVEISGYAILGYHSHRRQPLVIGSFMYLIEGLIKAHPRLKTLILTYTSPCGGVVRLHLAKEKQDQWNVSSFEDTWMPILPQTKTCSPWCTALGGIRIEHTNWDGKSESSG